MFSAVPGYSCFVCVGQSLFFVPRELDISRVVLRFGQLESKTLDELSEKELRCFQPSVCLSDCIGEYSVSASAGLGLIPRYWSLRRSHCIG